jgi:lysine N6-hydroxylase
MDGLRMKAGRPFDLIGIGAGPANLSLAALADAEAGLRCRFLDRKPQVAWHPTLMFDGAMMQTSFLEDLVTPVDPTSRFSFLAFLSDTGRMYQFLCTNSDKVTRAEFEQYLRWAASRLSSLDLSTDVREVTTKDGLIDVRTDYRTWSSAAVSVGIGTEPVIPDWMEPNDDRFLLAERLIVAAPNLTGKRVTVVGGGQTAAEIVLLLIGGKLGECARIDWISRRQNYFPLDDTSFVSEFFTPQYVDRFRSYGRDSRHQALREQKLFADGISRDTLRSLYHALYQSTYVRGCKEHIRLFPCQEVVDASSGAESIALKARDCLTQLETAFSTDLAVVCTGYRQKFPGFLESLGGALRLEPDGSLPIDKDFRLVWDRRPGLEIFVQNGARHTHGIADPQLCLLAWRSATILNAIVGYDKYCVTPRPGFIRWAGSGTAIDDEPDRGEPPRHRSRRPAAGLQGAEACRA